MLLVLHLSGFLVLLIFIITNGKANIIKQEPYKTDAEAKILGGEKAELGQFPYMVSLEIIGENEDEPWHFCGGSIMSKKWVITAAHCTKGMQKKSIQVRAGSLRRHVGGTVHQISQKVIHPGYGTNLENDLSLLRVKEPFIFSESVRPVKLPEHNERLEEGTELIVAGWGTTGQYNRGSKALKFVHLKVINPWECKYRYLVHEFNMNVTDTMLCAVDEGRDSRRGDSGGPLVLPTDDGDVLVGIVSWGDDSTVGTVEAPGVYTYVSQYRNYIRLITST